MNMSIEEEITPTIDIAELRRSMSKKMYTVHKFSGEITRMDIRIIRAIIQRHYKLVNLTVILSGRHAIQLIIQENKIIYCSDHGEITNQTNIKITPNKIGIMTQQPRIGMLFTIGHSLEYIQDNKLYRNVLAVARLYN